MDDDDLDDVLDGRKAETEERFRELERDAELERLRSQSGGASKPGAKSAAPPGQDRPAGSTPDPLADLKAAVEGGEVERYVLVECPHCQGKNRVALSKLRRAEPRCGRCKKELSFTKL